MKKIRLLDLFCGAGGCSMGYHLVGFDVTGVDLHPQPHYPFSFIQADAMMFPLDDFDIIHASPPCQAYSSVTIQFRLNGIAYPDLLAATRERLRGSGKPWIIENVMGAPVQHGLLLCGSMFGLRVRRHRYFESSHLFFNPGPCCHDDNFVSIFGEEVIRQKRNPAYQGKKCGIRQNLHETFSLAVGQEAMGIDWMNVKELSQAIPPAYTRYIGKQLKDIL